MEERQYTVNDELIEQVLAALDKGLSESVISLNIVEAVKTIINDLQTKIIPEAEGKAFEDTLKALKDNLEDEITQKINRLEIIAELQKPMEMLLQTNGFVADEKILEYKIGIENAEKDIIRSKYGHKSPLSQFLVGEINAALLKLFIECFSKDSTFDERLKNEGDDHEFKLLNRFLQYLSVHESSISCDVMVGMEAAIENYIDIYKVSNQSNNEEDIAMFGLINKIFPAFASNCSKSSTVSSESEFTEGSSSTESPRRRRSSYSTISLSTWSSDDSSEEKTQSGSGGVQSLVQRGSAAVEKSNMLYKQCNIVFEALSRFFQFITDTLMKGIKCVADATPEIDPAHARHVRAR